jgi:hypothetical protein
MMADSDIDEDPIGTLAWHCSDKDSGPDVGVSIKLGDNEVLWLGEITRKLHAEAGCPGDDLGWWIIYYNGPASTPIAKCFDEEAARDLFDRLALAIKPKEQPNDQ